MKANDWGSGVILKGKMEVVRTRHKMLGYSGLCVADAGSSKWCGPIDLDDWVVLELNKKASSGLIDLIVYILLRSLCGLEQNLPCSYGDGCAFLTAQQRSVSRDMLQNVSLRFIGSPLYARISNRDLGVDLLTLHIFAALNSCNWKGLYRQGHQISYSHLSIIRCIDSLV